MVWQPTGAAGGPQESELRAGTVRPSMTTNVLLQHPGLGEIKRCTFSAPPPGHVFGYQPEKDPEGAREGGWVRRLVGAVGVRCVPGPCGRGRAARVVVRTSRGVAGHAAAPMCLVAVPGCTGCAGGTPQGSIKGLVRPPSACCKEPWGRRAGMSLPGGPYAVCLTVERLLTPTLAR